MSMATTSNGILSINHEKNKFISYSKDAWKYMFYEINNKRFAFDTVSDYKEYENLTC